jgi:hypothetical protein
MRITESEKKEILSKYIGNTSDKLLTYLKRNFPTSDYTHPFFDEPIKQISIIPVEDAKHLWVGEPAVYRVLSEITKVIAPDHLPLPEEF